MDNTSTGSAERPVSSESFPGSGALPPPGGGGSKTATPDSSHSPTAAPATSVHSSASFRRPASLDSPHLTVTVVVQKDGTGYGMKVSGDNPVYVQAVKEGGAAERAGLHSGDKIIKVNGVNVTQSTHTEVVELIKSAPQVVLTVQQRAGGVCGASFRSVTMPAAAAPSSSSLWGTSPGSQCGSPSSSSPISPPTTPGPGTRGGSHHFSSSSHHHHHHHKNSSERITGPQPVDTEKLRQLEHQRVRTFQLMLEKEQCYVDRLRSELVRSNDPKKRHKSWQMQKEGCGPFSSSC